MASLSNHVTLTITQDSVGVARAGFGVPLHVSYSAAWIERVREYASLAEVAADFPTTTSPEYLAAQAFFSQSPRPTKIKIGRGALPPTQRYTIVPTASNSTDYGMTVNGDGFAEDEIEVTSDSAATVAEISSALITALNAVTGNNYLASGIPLVVADVTFTTTHAAETLTIAAHGLQTGDGPVRLSNSGGALPTGLAAATDYWVIRVDANTIQLASTLANALAGTAVTFSDDGTGTHTLLDTASTVRYSDGFYVTGDAAGEWFSLEVADPTLLEIAQTHADPGIATDLAAIALADGDWYALSTTYNSNAMVLAAAAWVESNKKIYVVDVNETDAITTAAGNSDTLDDLHTLERARTMGGYHPSPAVMFSQAWMGRVLPIEPGSETWKFKRLSGVPAVTLTSTQRSNLRGRQANSYETVAGINITFEGTTADGDFMDVTRGLDWLEDDMSKGVFEALAGQDKIPYTDAGVAVVEAEVRASLERAVARQILADDPAPTVTVPLVASVSTANKSIRLLPDVKFSGTLAGAIHKCVITGVVSV